MPDVANHVVDGGTTIVDCGSCHDPHHAHESLDAHTGQTATNRRLIRADIATYVPQAIEPAVYHTRPDHFSFQTAPFNGICQACHVDTQHHTQDGQDPDHFATADCLTCHQHVNGFQPGGCTDCHAQVQGGRRQIVDAGGDFSRTSHHVQGEVQDADCLACHYVRDHGSQVVKLKDPDAGDALVYEFDPAAPEGIEAFCLGCHDADGAAAGGGLQPFSDGQTPPDIAAGGLWSASAHNRIAFPDNGDAPITCYGDGTTSGCHANAHGSENIKLLAAAGGVSLETFCFGCHTDGRITNVAISGTGVADDIEESFGMAETHDLGSTFMVQSNTYTLQCTTCHNPHVVTGGYWDAAEGYSPVTRPALSADPLVNPRAVGSSLWGAVAGEKMADFAGSGTYRTPNGDLFSGEELPDYDTFCLDCHANMNHVNGGINWSYDAHGLYSANVPNGGGRPPDWYTCGKATGWDGDDNIGDVWPPLPRGRGEQLWSRNPYYQEERIAGANFVLSCTDCHEAHGSGISSMLRTNPNGGTGTVIWNIMCNNCHYYYSDWHAGMSCASASCHISQRMVDTGTNTMHEMAHAHGSTATRIFDPELVLDMRFENNLNDSGSWRLHGTWRVSPGSFVTGRIGSAIELNDEPLEVGTRNEYWSTDEGQHGTWKYTEMKYNMTLEAWVYPTDDVQDERIVMAKHTYWDGGYALTLVKVDGSYRAGLLTNVNGGGEYGVWDADANGLRGAFSTVAVPLNEWTHIAATYDAAGPDRDPNDPSVGRVRIYVNGEDVTWSYPLDSQAYCQPGPGEEAMFPYSDHSFPEDSDPESPLYHQNPWGYDGHWCASALSVGGLNWSAPDDSFIGRLDEVKIWNVTKPASYFSAVDAATAPRISSAEGMVNGDQLVVIFSEGVTGAGGGALQPGDFTLVDLDEGRSILQVTHTAGEDRATLLLSAPLDDMDDLGVDTPAPAAGAIHDEYGNAAETTPRTIGLLSLCPDGPTGFELNDSTGSTFIFDASQYVMGLVNYIDFESNNNCFQAMTRLTLEARIRPSTLEGTDNCVRRIFARDSNGGNYQVSVWRKNTWETYQAPDGVTSIAFWLRPVDNHGGLNWKLILTDYDLFPIVSDHFYRLRVVWDSSKPGAIPGDIFVDDQGPLGDDVGELWSGYRNATDVDQHLIPAERLLYAGDRIRPSDGDFVIGAGVNNHANNVFVGLIDWIRIDLDVDYSGLDDPPYTGGPTATPGPSATPSPTPTVTPTPGGGR
jgi:predicted CXXCH cytochrome family protein